ncbi:epidermal growth factor receptor substrate 15-like 1 isoform X2 [Diachasma alloeum]|uniref:epidermal growth factor receptor substrate 15-like 1 isoform X2 n=1 Tax=Diachasma alloeum TaxID=454923 RepID=UPI0010FB70BE|nr:epidermal growth factor receptor substrate 15-like 1 isoform X2 [Diachasma alloeum]
MAALPSPTQVAGSHVAIYEAYYHQVDPNNCGRIGAMEAARFLKKSQLSDIILSKIWDMADPQSRGSLDKSGMFVALKLCAFAQAGHELNIANVNIDVPPPKMGEIPVIPKKSPAVPPPPVISSIANGDWAIKPAERIKYDRLFDSLQPANGYIPGNKVKGVLMDSKLPLDTLGKIWDLADMDKDGMLDRHEFVVAMHLVYKALEKYAIPSVLPPELMPPGKRKETLVMNSTSPVPPAIPPLPTAAAVNNLVGLESIQPMPPQQPSPQPQVQWVVTAEDQAAADKLFLQADMDMDGFVSGGEIKDVFLQSGLPQNILAHIWGLCDICQSGKLNKEQFALAMWLIKQKLRGTDPPQALTPEMMPPSLRKAKDGGVVENNNISGYSNPELDMISKDIAELARERRAMEQDVAQKEADIKIKNGEIKSLQSELDTLAATLKQLENQRGEAQKRLNDLKAQRDDVEKELSQVEQEMREEQEKVDKLRQQAEEQESVLRTQEEELNSKRQELEGLRQEEQQLETQQNRSRDQLNELTKNLQNTQLQISQAKLKITHLEEQQRQMNDAIAMYDSALAVGDPSLVSDAILQLHPDIDVVEQIESEMSAKINGVSETGKDGFTGVNGASDGFGQEDPFASSKAAEAFGNSGGDPFANFDGRNSASSGFTSDPFAAKQEAYDPFGDGRRNDKAGGESIQTKDPFGDDPFANLHAPTRAESPSPALPPKKAKQPPPRPAPPRPAAGPNLRAAPAPPTPSPTPDPFNNTSSDPFAAQNDNNNGNTGFGSTITGFADFANFDSKPEVASRPSNAVSPPQKLPDFTEDPFRNYRYEDVFEIADPFADDETNANELKTKDKKTDVKFDPFGLEMTNDGKRDPFTRDFESDFSKTFSQPFVKSKNDKFSFTPEKNSNISNNNSSSPKPVNKPINFDEAFSSIKRERTKRSDNVSIAQAFKDKLGLGHNNLQKSKNNNNGKVWSEEAASMITGNLSEHQQLEWAAQQSLRAEEERKRIKEQEEADLALALKLSREEKSSSKF